MGKTIGSPLECYLCGRNGAADPLDKHHVYGGPYRKQSEEDGLCVMLCHHDCHIYGVRAIHNNADKARHLRREVQQIAMERYGWTEDAFRERYGRSYL